MEKLVLTGNLGADIDKTKHVHRLGRVVAARNFLELVGTGLLDSDDTEVSLDTGCVCLSGHVSSIQAGTTDKCRGVDRLE